MIWLAWIGFAGLLTWMFDGFLENRHNPNQHVQSTVNDDRGTEISLQRNRQGHYVVNGRINDQPVVFLLDTGATNVIVSGELANRIGLRRGVAHHANTANGIIVNYATSLDRVSIGPLSLKNIRASINPRMRGNEVLLGMSFLKRLELRQRGDQLILRTY